VAKLLRVTLRTLQRWDADGSLPARIRSKGGHRRYLREDLLTFLGKSLPPADRTAAIYARVSTRKQSDAGKLERQRLRLLERAAIEGYHVVLQAEDVASGLNTKRRGLRKVIRAAKAGEIKFVLVEHQDRLARFGFVYLVELLELLGVKVVITAVAQPEDAEADLVKDLLAIAISFSAKLYGMRGGRKTREGLKKLLEEVGNSGAPQEAQGSGRP
ncbi:MAG: IS607 family transposase, partial [Thermaerobacter sp.]|nr:IS607 family transposase [Thermaerobacter sp.]